MLSSSWLRIWQEKLEKDLPIDITTTEKNKVQYLLLQLLNRNRPYIIYNMGSGVTRLTTDTQFCPCCKKKL
jgi:hypothetical protein